MPESGLQFNTPEFPCVAPTSQVTFLSNSLVCSNALNLPFEASEISTITLTSYVVVVKDTSSLLLVKAIKNI